MLRVGEGIAPVSRVEEQEEFVLQLLTETVETGIVQRKFLEIRVELDPLKAQMMKQSNVLGATVRVEGAEAQELVRELGCFSGNEAVDGRDLLLGEGHGVYQMHGDVGVICQQVLYRSQGRFVCAGRGLTCGLRPSYRSFVCVGVGMTCGLRSSHRCFVCVGRGLTCGLRSSHRCFICVGVGSTYGLRSSRWSFVCVGMGLTYGLRSSRWSFVCVGRGLTCGLRPSYRSFVCLGVGSAYGLYTLTGDDGRENMTVCVKNFHYRRSKTAKRYSQVLWTEAMLSRSLEVWMSCI